MQNETKITRIKSKGRSAPAGKPPSVKKEKRHNPFPRWWSALHRGHNKVQKQRSNALAFHCRKIKEEKNKL